MVLSRSRVCTRRVMCRPQLPIDLPRIYLSTWLYYMGSHAGPKQIGHRYFSLLAWSDGRSHDCHGSASNGVSWSGTPMWGFMPVPQPHGANPPSTESGSGSCGQVNCMKAMLEGTTPGRVLAVVRHGCSNLAEREPRLLNDLIAGLTAGTERGGSRQNCHLRLQPGCRLLGKNRGSSCPGFWSMHGENDLPFTLTAIASLLRLVAEIAIRKQLLDSKAPLPDCWDNKMVITNPCRLGVADFTQRPLQMLRLHCSVFRALGFRT